ncbi:hypothetical protein DV515_00004346 [Chloebia gouldiae]|uniref:Uncharacterized protein n=1 Tax=Chloebia gouldiae TaxID=44316 RepID=A0A3L8ST23_CHLGU|nr:hypothetical protein DV515_00004346 [Chloebia gouldiae]
MGRPRRGFPGHHSAGAARTRCSERSPSLVRNLVSIVLNALLASMRFGNNLSFVNLQNHACEYSTMTDEIVAGSNEQGDSVENLTTSGGESW